MGGGDPTIQTINGRESLYLNGTDSYYIFDLDQDSTSDYATLINSLNGNSSRTFTFWYKPISTTTSDSVTNTNFERSQIAKNSFILRMGPLSNFSTATKTALGANNFGLHLKCSTDGKEILGLPGFTPGGVSTNSFKAKHPNSSAVLPKSDPDPDPVNNAVNNDWMFAAIVYDGGHQGGIPAWNTGGTQSGVQPFKYFHGFNGGTNFELHGFNSDDEDLKAAGKDWRQDSDGDINRIDTLFSNIFFGASYNSAGLTTTDASSAGFKGYLHDFRFYGAALSESDITEIFQDVEPNNVP
jgi:hypothetical protein